MRRILAVAGALAGLFLASWLVFAAFGLLTPEATQRWLLNLPPTGAAAAMFLLLAADLLIPVPSSIVLSAGGIVLGGPLATLAGTAGLAAGGAAGYALCRRWGRTAFARLVSPAEEARFAAFLDRFGPLAVTLSRPVPLVAETLVCLAGLGRMKAGRFLAALLLGCAPYAAFFALTGAHLGRTEESPGLALAIALTVPAAYWLLFALFARRL